VHLFQSQLFNFLCDGFVIFSVMLCLSTKYEKSSLLSAVIKILVWMPVGSFLQHRMAKVHAVELGEWIKV
jgi:hypothetical protein